MEIIKPGYTRVSDILSIFQNYWKVDPAKLKKHQDLGVLVHDAIERHLKGEFVPIQMPLTPYFESFLKWEKVYKPKPLVIEKRYYDDQLMVTGRIDLLAEIEQLNVLVDWKTGSWAHPEIWALQGTFYRAFIEDDCIENNGPEVPDSFQYVQLRSDGEMPTVHAMKYDSNWWDVCMSAMRCYKYFKKENFEGF